MPLFVAFEGGIGKFERDTTAESELVWLEGTPLKSTRPSGSGARQIPFRAGIALS